MLKKNAWKRIENAQKVKRNLENSKNATSATYVYCMLSQARYISHICTIIYVWETINVRFRPWHNQWLISLSFSGRSEQGQHAVGRWGPAWGPRGRRRGRGRTGSLAGRPLEPAPAASWGNASKSFGKWATIKEENILSFRTTSESMSSILWASTTRDNGTFLVSKVQYSFW